MPQAITPEAVGDMPVRYRRRPLHPEWSSGATGMNQQVGPRDLIRVVHRYRALMLTIIAVVTGLVLIHELLSPPMYRSTSNLQIELIDEVGTNQADVNSRNAERVANAVRLHRSRSAAEQVIKDLNLLHEPRFWGDAREQELKGKALMHAAINRLLEMISINAQAGSDLVEVVVTSRSPDLAAAVANQLPASVRKLRTMKSNERRAKLLSSLERELVARDAIAKGAALAVDDFRQKHRMLVGSGGENDLAQLDRIAVQSIAATAARDASAARAVGAARAASLRSTAMATSGALDQLERRRGELLGEMSKLNTSLGPNHPDVKRLNAQVANVDSSIGAERARVQAAAASVAAAESARATQLARSEAAGDAAQASRNMVELSVLMRNANLTGDAYEAIASRVEQVRAQMQLEGVSSSLVSPAVPNYDPVSPMPLKMTLTALLSSAALAFLLAFTRDFLDDKLRTMVQIRRLFGLPTLGMLPLIDSGVPDDPEKSLVISEPQSLFAEVARSAYCEVRALRRKSGAQVVLISSPLPGDGKSTVSLTLAAAGLTMGEKTVILDLDLRKVGALQQLQNGMAMPDLVDIVCGRHLHFAAQREPLRWRATVSRIRELTTDGAAERQRARGRARRPALLQSPQGVAQAVARAFRLGDHQRAGRACGARRKGDVPVRRPDHHGRTLGPYHQRPDACRARNARRQRLGSHLRPGRLCRTCSPPLWRLRAVLRRKRLVLSGQRADPGHHGGSDQALQPAVAWARRGVSEDRSGA